MAEEWRDISGYEGIYRVSSHGRVLSVARKDLKGRRCGDEFLAGFVDRYGYVTVLLSKGGKKRRHKVHRLVCAAFHGPAPAGREVGHADGNRAHNNASNLRWVTRAENVADMMAHGTHRFARPPKAAMRRGSSSPNAVLTEGLVREIRAKAASGRSGRSLAREYGIGSGHASAIIRGDAWAHVGSRCALSNCP